MRISSPRKGSELDPRVFATWQEQVIRAIRALGFSRASISSVVIDFPSIAAGGQATSSQTIPGARVGGTVSVSTNAGAPTAGLLFDGYVSANDTVIVRATNITTGAVDAASAAYAVSVLNP